MKKQPCQFCGTMQEAPICVPCIKTRAEQGDEAAQLTFSIQLYNGRGVPQNYEMAVMWCHKSAKQGYANAQFYMGMYYMVGNGVPQDKAKAVEWFRLAAEQGHATAQCELGVFYLHGTGVRKDKAQAASFFRKAAEQGDTRAQYYLGLMCKNGHGTPQEAMDWLQKAAEQGHDEARSDLIQMQNQQKKDDAKLAQARAWYAKGLCWHCGSSKKAFWSGKAIDCKCGRHNYQCCMCNGKMGLDNGPMQCEKCGILAITDPTNPLYVKPVPKPAEPPAPGYRALTEPQWKELIERRTAGLEERMKKMTPAQKFNAFVAVKKAIAKETGYTYKEVSEKYDKYASIGATIKDVFPPTQDVSKQPSNIVPK